MHITICLTSDVIQRVRMINSSKETKNKHCFREIKTLLIQVVPYYADALDGFVTLRVSKVALERNLTLVS